jgi:hypothetical protein
MIGKNNVARNDFRKRMDDLTKSLDTKKLTFTIQDLWVKKILSDTKKELIAEIASHDVMMVRLVKQ